MRWRKIICTQLEAEIVAWFRSDDQLHPLAEIQEKFSHVPEAELQEALDSLCQLGILYGGKTMILDLYGLA